MMMIAVVCIIALCIAVALDRYLYIKEVEKRDGKNT